MYGASLPYATHHFVELTETCSHLSRRDRPGCIFRETYTNRESARSTFNLLCNYTMQRQNGSTQQGRAMGEYGVGVITREMRKIAILVGIINSAIRADVRIVKVKALAFDSQPAICKSESIRLSLVNYSRASMWSIGVLRGGCGQ